MRNYKLLIVGGTGYLGRHLRKILGNDCGIFFTGTKSIEAENYIYIDFKNPSSFETLKGVFFEKILILSASISGIGHSSLASKDIDVNTFAYATFLEFIKINSICEKIIYISSMTVYGSRNCLPVLESASLSPVHSYGLSKRIAEQFTEFVCNTSPIKGLVVRLPGLYGGDRESGFIYNAIKTCLCNRPLVIDINGLKYWEAIEVNDASIAICELMNTHSWDASCDVYNISYGEQFDIFKTARLIKYTTNSTSDIVVKGLNSYEDFFLDNRKLKSVINFNKSFIGSLNKYINKFKS